MKQFLLTAFVGLLGFSALAETNSEDFNTLGAPTINVEAYVVQGNETLKAISEGKAQEVWAHQIKAVMKFAFQLLREKGHSEFAHRTENEWMFYSHQLELGSIGMLDLGDHRPLSEWLGWFYRELESLLGRSLCTFFHLDDIKAFNYGYIVTFHPEGDPITREVWDKIEYKKHFVPFVTASFYWSAYIACALAAPFPGSFACSMGLQFPRYVIKHWVAPPVAGQVYTQTIRARSGRSAKENN